MAAKKWAAFPHIDKTFDYSADKLAKVWDKLHAGDQEPYPDIERVSALLKSNSKLGKTSDAAKLAEKLQDAWRAYHRGDFEHAFEIGEALGPIGAAVACRALNIHTNHLIDDDKEKLKRFQQVVEMAEHASAALPKEANVHYARAYAYGRFSQLISIAKALTQGIAGRVKESLDQTLKLAPKHAEAHTALAMYHAEIVGKVGSMLASLTYGAKASSSEEHLKQALKLTPDSPITNIENGNALMLLYGDKKEDAAASSYQKATKLKARDAMEALDIAFAKAQLE